MEDLPVKAIVIGVSVFVTMAVVSALILYFNTARELVTAASKRTDIAKTYDEIMNPDVSNGILTGVQARALINKYAGDETVIINIVSISGINATEISEKTGKSYNNINNLSKENDEDTNTDNWLRNNGVISEEKLDLINPVWNCSVEKVENSGITTLNLNLDVDIEKED